MTDIAGTVPVIAVDKVQAVALAVCTYYFGVWLKGKVGVLSRYSIPSPVVGGMSFAIVVSFLEYFNIVKVQIDSTLQTVLMLGFFTTIGLMASLRVVKDGGRLLLGFLLAVTVLVFLQNGMGMAIAEAMGFDKHYGILAGSVSMMGGLGTAAAFGPYFEETYGITGGTAVAVTAATFGMVAALLIGGPFGEWCIRRYKVKTPDEVQQPEPELHLPDDMDTDITEQHASAKPNFTNEIMRAVSVTALAMGLGTIVSNFLGHYITLPAYIGAMIIATIIRNVGDFSGMYKVEGKGLNAVADITLVLFVTMAINNLKLHELVHLALPLVVILACQTILMLIYAWTVLFTAFGRSYDAVMLSVGGIGFSMGATANGLANMQAISEKYGSSPRAWLIVSVVGAVSMKPEVKGESPACAPVAPRMRPT